MKKLFLSSSFGYEWDQIKTWNLSAKRTGHDVCNMLINPSNQLVNACKENGVDAVCYNMQQTNKPPHNLRFLFQYKYLMSVKEKYSHVILTDSRDVYFHEDPFPKLLDIMSASGKKIVCGGESITFKNESWNSRNLADGYGYVFDEYVNQEVKNVGVLCGDVQSVAELCLQIFSMCIHNPAPVSDQSSFNVLLGTNFFSDKIHTTNLSDGFMVHLAVCGVEKFAANLIESPSWKSNELPNISGNVYPIIHQYDRIQNLDRLFSL
jgi:hypothetical protein